MRGGTMSFITRDITPEHYDLLMGALLHDIGKFYMRTDDSTVRAYIKNRHGSAAHQFWGDIF